MYHLTHHNIVNETLKNYLKMFAAIFNLKFHQLSFEKG